MRKNVYFVLLLVVALVAGAWTLPSMANGAVAQRNPDATSACDHASTELVGMSADLPRLKGLIHDICGFRVNMDQVPKNVSEFDKDFIEDSITSNTLELQSLQIALNGTTNEEWRGQIMMMIDMHTSDLQMALAVAKKIGADTKPDLTHASVYPETPDYDLGIRFENLVEKYLNPLQAAAPGGGVGTPTGVPTDMTAVGTTTETETATAVGTVVAAETGTATATMTGMPSDTATAAPTDTSTETMTAVPSDTATALPTDTATETMTTMPSETPTTVPTDTATGVPTETPTLVPGGGGTGTSFDVVSLNIIEDEHVSDIQSELVAERLVQNDELKAFAKHAADVTELHIMLMDHLKHRLVDNYTPPTPEFQQNYQSPRRFEPR